MSGVFAGWLLGWDKDEGLTVRVRCLDEGKR